MFFVIVSFCFSYFNGKIEQSNHKSLILNTNQKMIKEEEFEDLFLTQATGNYADNAYISQHRVPNDSFTYYSPGDQATHNLNLAFDGKTNTFWASSVVITETTKSYLLFNFTKLTYLEGILYGPAYSTNRSTNPYTRRYDGFPRVLNIYTSCNDEELQLRYTFRGYPALNDVWNFIQLIFSQPLWCDKLKIEFVEVTLDIAFGSNYTAACSELIFMSPAEEFTRVEVAQAAGNYVNSNYISTNRITTSDFTYFVSSSKANHQDSYLFDGLTDYYWVPSTNNTKSFKNFITFNFNSLTHIEAFVFNPAYSTNTNVSPKTRRYDGFPYVMKVYTSSNDEPFKLNHIFTGLPSKTSLWDKTQYVFASPIWCDKLKIEFTEITLDIFFGNDYTVACNELFLFRVPTTDVPAPTPAQTVQPEYKIGTVSQATGNYANANYLNTNRVPLSEISSYETPGDKSGKPFTNAFDGQNSYWSTSTVNNETFKNYVKLNFNSLKCLGAIVYAPAYSTNKDNNPITRRYGGYPTVLKVFTSTNGDPYKLSYVFSQQLASTDVWDYVTFAFDEPICTDKLKIEFTEVTLNIFFGNDYSVACNELYLMNEVPVATPSRSPTATKSPSPTASQSPSQSPTPERTPHQGSSDDTYINKNYTGSIPLSTTNQIQVGGANEVTKQISGCRFTDLDITNRVFFIKVNGASSIFDNVFERSTYTTGKAGCIWYAFSSSNKFIISNCKFIRITGKDGDASVLNVNGMTLANIEFRDCIFKDCGEKGDDRPIVNILHKESTIGFYNCNFSYEEPQISRVLELKGCGATFDGCYFDNCGQNSIDLGIEEVNIDTHQTFRFTNNHVKSVNTRFINAPRIHKKPEINNNIFESCTLNDEYFIYILHDQEEIEFTSNTFSNFNNRGTSKGNCGGLSSFVERSGSKFKLLYKECQFINIINEHTTHPMNQGGALQYFSDNNYEVDIEITKCEFKMNKAPHHGGSISIQTSGSISITDCTFEMNEANYRTTSSRLLYENYYDQKTKGFGGAIYLNPTFNKANNDYSSTSITISGCTFNKNRAHQGYAIYIEGDTSSTTYNINNNNFNNNYESEGSPNTNGIIASEDLLLTIDSIESSSNQFTNDEFGQQSVKFMRVDHKGNFLTEGNFVFGDENFTQTQPTDRIEKELDSSSTDEVTVKVKVVVSEFSTKVNDNGGAIHIVNCALECTGTTFRECKSPSGGGGGIYIENTGGKENIADLIGLKFNGCEAEYGGAVYIYSSTFENAVTIKFCDFIGNKATVSSSDASGSKKYGGAAIFLTAKKGDLNSNTFKDNEGDGGAVRIYNKFNKADTKSAKVLDNKNVLLISDCSFEIGKKSDCCLFYLRGSDGSNVELQKCEFTGHLNSGCHYIDGKSLSKNGPKLFVKKCKFGYDSANSVNMKDYLSIDLNDQSFLFDKSMKESTKKLSFKSWMIIGAVCVAALAIAIVIIVLVVKKKKNSNNIEENEMSTEVRNLLLNDSSDMVINSSLI